MQPRALALSAALLIALAATAAATAPVILNADLSGGVYGFLAGEVPVAFVPLVRGGPADPPRFSVPGSGEVRITASSPCVAALEQELHAGFGHPLRFRARVAVSGDAVCRLGLIRRDDPEDADWSEPVAAGEAALLLETRADHPGARLRIEFAVRGSGEASLRFGGLTAEALR